MPIRFVAFTAVILFYPHIGYTARNVSSISCFFYQILLLSFAIRMSSYCLPLFLLRSSFSLYLLICIINLLFFLPNFTPLFRYSYAFLLPSSSSLAFIFCHIT